MMLEPQGIGLSNTSYTLLEENWVGKSDTELEAQPIRITVCVKTFEMLVFRKIFNAIRHT